MSPFTLPEEVGISASQLPSHTLVTMRSLILVFTLLYCILSTSCCEQNQYQNGCRISGNICECGYGCLSKYIYKNRRECHNALRAPQVLERSSNICFNLPCLIGICIQTSNEPGYTCKCEGTGFYGQRCERACPTTPVYGRMFPHECVVI